LSFFVAVLHTTAVWHQLKGTHTIFSTFTEWVTRGNVAGIWSWPLTSI